LSKEGKRRVALITGITGQDGSYLAEYLLSLGYDVHGIIRKSSSFNTSRIDHIYVDPHTEGNTFFLHFGDLSDGELVSKFIYSVKPDEVYNLAAQSHVRVSFDMPEYTGNVNALGTARLLERIRGSESNTRLYQASTSEMFGNSPPPQDENTPFRPRSPYAIAKLYAHLMSINYRESYNMFCANGILFNHESPRRGETFVTRKITMAIARIVAKRDKTLFLGNLDAQRDWGFAPEYVECMHKMLNVDKPDDFVIGTGETHSVREFLEHAFSYMGLDYTDFVKIDKRYFRPSEVESLKSNPSKANKKLGWKPKINFDDLVKIMVDSDMRKLDLTPIGEGDEILKRKFPEKWWRTD